MKTVHLLISGKVQGVFFRASAKKIAIKYQVKGWVRNTKTKNVEAMATADEQYLDLFITWCKTGPDNAKVEQVIVSQLPLTPYDSFEIIR